MKTKAIITALLLSATTLSAQNFQWAKKLGSPYSQSWSLPASDKGSSISVDSDDNIILGGVFKETSDFDPGASTFNLTSQGGHDMFIVKLNPTGDFLWAVSFGNNDTSEEGDKGISVTTDNSGNIYCTGGFKGTVDFDPGSGVYELTSVGYTDIFVLKLDPTGQFVWAKQVTGTRNDYERTIAIDPDDNVIVTGAFTSTVDFDPGVDVYQLTGAGDVFVLKLTNNGDFVWARSMGGLGLDEGTSIITDGSGNIFAGGYYSGNADMDPGAGVYELTSLQNSNPFICKLNASGDFVWAKGFESLSGYGRLNSLTLDSDGNVYSAGEFYGMVDFDPGAGTLILDDAGNFSGSDAFITKLDPLGNLTWAKQLGGNDVEEGYSILVDALGDVYSVGMYQADADFNPGPLTYELEAVAGSHDIFISKLSSAGNFVWAKSIGGNSPSKDIAWSMDFNSTGNILVTGQFYATADFNPAGGTYNLTSSGSSDIFVVALDGFATSGPSTGMQDQSQISGLGVFPNPNQGTFTLNSPEHGRILIYNTLGAMVSDHPIMKGQTIIDLHEQTSGVYQYTFLGQMGTHTSGKIVVN